MLHGNIYCTKMTSQNCDRIPTSNRLVWLHRFAVRNSESNRLCTNQLQKTYADLADILIVTKGSMDVHSNTLQKVPQKFYEENLAISIDKIKIVCKQFVWLGYHIDSEGTTTFTRKTEAIEKLSPPRNFK